MKRNKTKGLVKIKNHSYFCRQTVLLQHFLQKASLYPIGFLQSNIPAKSFVQARLDFIFSIHFRKIRVVVDRFFVLSIRRNQPLLPIYLHTVFVNP